MKKIINEPKSVVTEMLQGFSLANSQIKLDLDNNIVYRQGEKEKVGIISGGGSGHEPAHSGYVGYGMLDAAVSGNVFASPDPFKIYNAMKHVDKKKGVLLIIKNYSGDVMNFEMASDMAKEDGMDVRSVYVNDDVSINNKDERRGIAGTVFVHKIAGAAAELEKDIDYVHYVAQKTVDNIRSFGFSLSSCTIPEVGTPIFSLNEDEIELGMGIHGELGVEKGPMRSSKEFASYLIDKVTNDDIDFINEKVAVLVNGLGSTTIMELNILLKDICELLTNKSIKPEFILVGNYMTSLEMAGASLSLLKLDEELMILLNKPCDTFSLKIGGIDGI